MEVNQNERDVGGACSEDCLTKDLPLSMIQNKVTDEDTDKNEAEDKQQRMSSQSGLEVDDQLSDEDIEINEAEDKQQRISSQSGLEVDDQLSDEDIEINEAEDKQQRMSSQSGLEFQVRPKECFITASLFLEVVSKYLPSQSAMKDFIKECRIPDMEEGNKLGDSPLTQEEDDEERRMPTQLLADLPSHMRKVMEELLLKTLLPRDISQSKEGWAKRDGVKPRTASSKYYTTPDILPVPKRAKLTVNTGEDIQSSTDVKNSSNDPTSKGSKPATEVIECYIRGILNLKDNAGRLYHLDHYTMGVILHGTREQMARQELKKVTFDLYDGAIGFVNIRNVHWKFVMRRNRLGKEDWVSIKWQPGKITHTFQKDATSCGAFVMQMAKMTVKEFPKIPQTFHINSSKKSLQNLRRDMAEEILKGSVSKDDFCSFCGIEDLPTTAVDAVWRYQDLGRLKACRRLTGTRKGDVIACIERSAFPSD
ncbi:hypothetical protein NQZ68_025267 [Dissostichus eleginoides]|nr:hypothetical protein NQZ68_025267 [Dissostichus eleginoides]